MGARAWTYLLGIGAVCLVGVGSALTFSSLQRVASGLDLLLQLQAAKETTVQTMQSTWTSSGVQHTVTTTRQDGESDAQFVTRHNNAVQAALKQFPPG